MLRSAVGKVMWVGRATVFLVGLAVILALVLGVASAALSATGGNFILGNSNVATAITKLTMQGTANGSALQVTQQSTGTSASGVGVTVPSGKAPIKVNAAAGKATNLNADKLDGQDSSEFVPTTTYPRTLSLQTNPTSTQSINWSCDDGDVLLSGGLKLNDPADQEIVESKPLDPVPAGEKQTWVGTVRDDNTTQGAGFVITVLCADQGTPHTG